MNNSLTVKNIKIKLITYILDSLKNLYAVCKKTNSSDFSQLVALH